MLAENISPPEFNLLQLYMPKFLCVLLNYLTFFAATVFLVSQVLSIRIVWWIIWIILPGSTLKLICQNVENIKVLWCPWVVLKGKNIQYSTMHNRFFLKKKIIHKRKNNTTSRPFLSVGECWFYHLFPLTIFYRLCGININRVCSLSSGRNALVCIRA